MSRKNTAVGVLAIVAGSTLLLGCGDGEQATGKPISAATGGKSAGTGGSSAHTGGTKSNGGATATGGSSAKSSGGASNTGGSSTNGGASATGGSGGLAGTSTAGSSNAGTTSTGGSSTIVGTSATGGRSATGGTTTQTGGSKATGGSSALSCAANFASPTSGVTLSNANDASGTCSDGIQFDVVVSTNAPPGTAATLSVTTPSGTTTQVAQTTVAGAQALFSKASLGSTGTVTLTANIGGTACQATESVTLNCAGAPTCTIQSPSISTAHPALNGVPAPNGDRASAVGAPYQVAFQVSTNAEDGQPVVLTADGVGYQATASSGVATFGGVFFTGPGGVPDGQTHTVSVTCTNRAGVVGSTGNITYPIDTTGPALTPQKGTGASGGTISALANGDHFAMADDADATASNGLQIKLCGTTSSADALDVPAPNQANFCASVGGNAPVCAAATTAGGSGACVNITCPGNGPFDVALALKDKAGNPTTVTRTSLTCASTSPTVTFLDPVSDVTPFSDVTKRILAATNTNATRRDKNATAVGAQYDVLACTSAPAGSTATLTTGYMGQTLTQAATTTVVAGTATQCTGSSLVQFFNVTLPESLTNSSFQLMTATELTITVTDLNLSTGSATADVWVDSTSPTLTLVSPTGFCGSYFNTSGTGNPNATVNLTFGSSIPVVVSVQGASGTSTFTGNTVTFSQVAVNGVQLEAGSDTVSAIATKPSTNFGTFGAAASCSVTVGNTPPPTVTWQTPLTTSLLTAAGNTNPNAIIDNSATAGWQGTLTACTNIDTTANPGATVQFSATVGGTATNIGTPVAIDATSKCASLANATVPEGQAVLLTATTSAVAGNSGVASITVPVSSTVPGAPTNLTVTIADRRLTSFTPNWTAPAGSTVTGYEVRVAKTAIATQANFDAARDIPYSGSGTCPGTGCTVLVDGCYIENDYYFAVAAVDYVGNQGTFVATSAATRATFIQTSINSTVSNGRFGGVIDATGDLNKDGFSDIIASYTNGTEVDIFFGGSSGVAATPSIKIQGPVNQFGLMVAAIGDVNNDGYEDMAIASAAAGNGTVYVFFGRSTANWNLKPTLTATDANVTITADSTLDANFANGRLGASIARLGDYNGDGIDDFAISAFGYNASTGLVAIVLGNASGLPATMSLPSAFGSGVLRIDGVTAGTRFGFRVLGIGRFYGASSTPALVVSAPLNGGTIGRLYSFTAAAGSPTTAAGALNTVDGLGTNDSYGTQALTSVGNIGPGGQPAIGINSFTSTPQRVDVLSGTVALGPFNSRNSYTSSESTTNTYGRLVVGGAMSGRSQTFSFIGPKGGRSDIAITTNANSLPRLYIVDGDKITMPVATTIEPPTADVVVPLTGTFTDFARLCTAIPDLDGDGYGDLVVADVDSTPNPIAGRIVVLR